MDPSAPGLSPPKIPHPDDRLDSWKEIAGYLRRDVTTVQRWEKREGMPVHRHVHDKVGSVYAFKSELDAWATSRAAVDDPASPVSQLDPPVVDSPARPGRRMLLWVAGAAAVLVATLSLVWALSKRDLQPDDVLAGARFVRLTDFGGREHAAALSRDGRYVAFLSDRTGRMDLWIGQVGSGQFYNLTQGAAFELVNPSLRTLGFSPDGTQVTYWARRLQPPAGSEINVWAVPVLGGAPRPYLEGIAEFDWSHDGSRLVYHTPGPGDPMFVRGSPESTPQQIFSAAPGLHAHFPLWSRDGRFVYFVQGTLPDRLDIWRIAATGGTPERLTHHDARVSHPVFVDDRTLLYVASDAHGGPWIHVMDVDKRSARRLSSGIERYTSLAASADASRLVATVASPRSSLWRMPFTDNLSLAAGTRLPMTTVSGSSPRLRSGYLLYVGSKGDAQSIWKLEGERAAEVWTAPATRIVGAPAISKDGSRIAFVAERERVTSLFTANADGTDARVVTSALRLQTGLAWSPDGKSLTVSALADGVPKLLSVPLDGGAPAVLVNEHAVDPVWSPDGRVLVYSGPDIGTTFQLKGVTASGAAAFEPLTLSRGSRHVRFTPDGRALLVLRGEIGHKDLWSVELETGRERRLSQFAADVNVQDFDISPDGREIVIEQQREYSDIVLIERTKR